MNKGFTLIEILVAIAIIAILSAVVLFSITLYINRSRDASTQGNLSTLIPAGEVYYDHNGGNGYGAGNNGEGSCGDITDSNFCCSDVVKSLSSRIDSAVVCNAATSAWAACAAEFESPERAFCVDSRGYKKEICSSSCDNGPTSCQDEEGGLDSCE